MSEYKEFPRLLYRGDGSERRVVNSEAEQDAALDAGFRLTKDAPSDAPVLPDAEIDAVIAEPKKRGRKPKAD